MRRQIVLLLFMALFASSCKSIGPKSGSALRPLKTKPPAAAIVFSKPAMANAAGAEVTFPAGKYLPMYEDDNGFYFQAQTKVLLDVVAVYGYDGGIYVARGTTVPLRWYVVGEGGQLSTGRFKTPPKYTVEP